MVYIIVVFLSFAKQRTHLVLEVPSLAPGTDTLIHNTEGQHMPVAGRKIAGQRRDTVQRSRLGMHIITGRAVRHTLA